MVWPEVRWDDGPVMVIGMYLVLRGINTGTKRCNTTSIMLSYSRPCSCHRNTREHVGNILVLSEVRFARLLW